MDKNGHYVLKIADDLYISSTTLNQGYPETTPDFLKAQIFDYTGVEDIVTKMAFVPECEVV